MAADQESEHVPVFAETRRNFSHDGSNFMAIFKDRNFNRALMRAAGAEEKRIGPIDHKLRMASQNPRKGDAVDRMAMEQGADLFAALKQLRVKTKFIARFFRTRDSI